MGMVYTKSVEIYSCLVTFLEYFEKNTFPSASSEICGKFGNWLLIGQSPLGALPFTDNMDFVLPLGLASQALDIDHRSLTVPY